jgi:hypothetical protein
MKQIVGKDLSYSIQGRHLILSEKAEKKEIPPTRKAEKKWVNLQESMHTLKGVVVDNITNDPLIGATIKIEGQPGGSRNGSQWRLRVEECIYLFGTDGFLYRLQDQNGAGW